MIGSDKKAVKIDIYYFLRHPNCNYLQMFLHLVK